jgi:hypothetical protein
MVFRWVKFNTLTAIAARVYTSQDRMLRMADERLEVTLPDLGRWLAAAVLIAAGLVLYLWLAPAARPIIEQPAVEAEP